MVRSEASSGRSLAGLPAKLGSRLRAVDIVRTTKARPEKPKFGTLKGKVIAHDPDWWKPMTDEEVDALLDGR